MRNLSIFIVLSAAAFAQNQAAQPTAAQPASVGVKPTSTQATQASKANAGSTKATAMIGPKLNHSAGAKNMAASSTKTTSAAPKVSVSAGAKVSAATAAPKAAAVSVQKAAGKAGSSTMNTNSAANTVAKAPAKAVVAVGPKMAPKAGPVAVAVPSRAGVKAGVATAKPAVAHTEVKRPKAMAVKPMAKVHAKSARSKPVVATVAPTKPSAGVADNKLAVGNKPREFHTADRRDPFVSPVVAMAATSGSGCSSGKRCLTIDQIALKGVVKSEAGMIAVVVNALDKAYFLRENDPVFNGYVVKITGDSIIFKETFHDRLGKTMTRDVTKSITRPVA